MDPNKINEGVVKLLPHLEELKGFNIAEKISVLQSTASLLQNTLAGEGVMEIYKNILNKMIGGKNERNSHN